MRKVKEGSHFFVVLRGLFQHGELDEFLAIVFEVPRLAQEADIIADIHESNNQFIDSFRLTYAATQIIWSRVVRCYYATVLENRRFHSDGRLCKSYQRSLDCDDWTNIAALFDNRLLYLYNRYIELRQERRYESSVDMPEHNSTLFDLVQKLGVYKNVDIFTLQNGMTMTDEAVDVVTMERGAMATYAMCLCGSCQATWIERGMGIFPMCLGWWLEVGVVVEEESRGLNVAPRLRAEASIRGESWRRRVIG